MKSAIELAMERSGGGGKKLTEAQKKEIAEIRSKGAAKKAQEVIMFKEKSTSLPPSQELEELERNFAHDIAKIEANMESEIEKIHNR